MFETTGLDRFRCGAPRIAAFALVLAAGACSSEAPVAAPVEPETVYPVVEDDSPLELGLAFAPEDESPPEDPVEVEDPVVDTSTTTTVLEPVLTQDPNTTHVRVDSDGLALNVRSAPSAEAEVVASLHPLTWYVETTGAVAEFEGALWRELRLVSGETGWAHADFLQQTDPSCTDISVDDIHDSTVWNANLDGDDLDDVVTHIRGTDGVVHVRVEFGNGAVTATKNGAVPPEMLDQSQAWAIAQDLNGDGYDEIQVEGQQGRGGSTVFFSMDGCAFNRHDKVFNTWISAGTHLSWGCTDFGTEDVQLYDIHRRLDEDGVATLEARGHMFHPTYGFAPAGDVLEMDDASAVEFFDALCSSDYD